MSNRLAASVVDDIKRKVEADDINGDINMMLLHLLVDVHDRMEEIGDNPMIVIGRLMKKYPALAWPGIVIGWVLVGAAAALSAIKFIDAIGLHLVRIP